MPDYLKQVSFNQDGLISAIAVDDKDGSVLMQAWMNEQALQETIARGEMVYYSRSRQRLWHKGESSGHVQKVMSLWLDCDGDALLARVIQQGGIACHTGRKSCFHLRLDGDKWQVDAPVLKDPKAIYG